MHGTISVEQLSLQIREACEQLKSAIQNQVSVPGASEKLFALLDELLLREAEGEEKRVKLFERVMESQEEDRRWIARELHDETGQSLAFVLVGLRLIEEARTLKQAKEEA